MLFDYDDRIASLVASDATSMDQVVAILTGIDEIADGTRDGLKWFNSIYLEVTLAVKARVEAKGFGDAQGGAFIEHLDFVFANLYFSALRGWLRNGEAPKSWQVLLEQRSNTQLARVQFALAGINAHINRDLAVAVVQTTSPSHGTSEYRAYTDLNSTLSSLIDEEKKELMVTLPGDALPGADRIEHMVAAWSVVKARESAWVHAEILAKISSETVLAGRYVDALDSAATLAGKALLIPVT